MSSPSVIEANSRCTSTSFDIKKKKKMNKYKFVIKYNGGYEDTVMVSAANRIMAFEIFREFGFNSDDISDAACYLVGDD